MKPYLCIDPGAKGGWVYCDNSGPVFSGGNDELMDLQLNIRTTVIIENVPPFVGRLIPSSASFKLGRSFGWLEGYFTGRGFPVVLVRPQAWQATAGVGTKGKDLTTSQWKNKLKSEAIRRYPNNKITLETADAFLLLSHARQHNL